MSTVLEYPETQLADTDYHAFNRAVWDRLCSDPFFSKIDFRIETDRHGQILMSPPPAPSHGSWQSRIIRNLDRFVVEGEIISDCPVSTSAGVKGIDVAWCSARIWQENSGRNCFLEAPELCVEILSPSNTRGEIAEKKSLYFEEGAKEVWICTRTGKLDFFTAPETVVENSVLFPGFPVQLER